MATVALLAAAEGRLRRLPAHAGETPAIRLSNAPGAFTTTVVKTGIDAAEGKHFDGTMDLLDHLGDHFVEEDRQGVITDFATSAPSRGLKVDVSVASDQARQDAVTDELLESFRRWADEGGK